MKNAYWFIPLVTFLCYGLGSIVFSQAVSFARWDEFHKASYFTNFHATLLSMAGFAICLLTGGVGFLWLRVSKLERVLRELRPTGKV